MKTYRGINIEMSERITNMFKTMCTITDKISCDTISIIRATPLYVDIKTNQHIEKIYTLNFKSYVATMSESCKSIIIYFHKQYSTILYDIKHYKTLEITTFLSTLDTILPEWLKEVEVLENNRKRRNKAWLDFHNAQLLIKSDFTRQTNIEHLPIIYYNCRAAYELTKTRDEDWKICSSLKEIEKVLQSKGINADIQTWKTECETAITNGLQKLEEKEKAIAKQTKDLARKKHLLTLQIRKLEVLIKIQEMLLNCKLKYNLHDNEANTSLDETNIFVFYEFNENIHISKTMPILNIDLQEFSQGLKYIIEIKKQIQPLLKEEKYDIYEDEQRFILAYKAPSTGFFSLTLPHYDHDCEIITPTNILIKKLNEIKQKYNLQLTSTWVLM